MLLGYLHAPQHAIALAHDAERAQDFADDLSRHQSATARHQSWTLLRTSLRAAFIRRLPGPTPNYDLNGKIAAAILGCFPAEAFDSAGVYHSLWLQKLSATANDAQLLVDEWLDDGFQLQSSESASLRRGRAG